MTEQRRPAAGSAAKRPDAPGSPDPRAAGAAPPRDRAERAQRERTTGGRNTAATAAEGDRPTGRVSGAEQPGGDANMAVPPAPPATAGVDLHLEESGSVVPGESDPYGPAQPRDPEENPGHEGEGDPHGGQPTRAGEHGRTARAADAALEAMRQWTVSG